MDRESGHIFPILLRVRAVLRLSSLSLTLSVPLSITGLMEYRSFKL